MLVFRTLHFFFFLKFNVLRDSIVEVLHLKKRKKGKYNWWCTFFLFSVSVISWKKFPCVSRFSWLWEVINIFFGFRIGFKRKKKKKEQIEAWEFNTRGLYTSWHFTFRISWAKTRKSERCTALHWESIYYTLLSIHA